MCLLNGTATNTVNTLKVLKVTYIHAVCVMYLICICIKGSSPLGLAQSMPLTGPV